MRQIKARRFLVICAVLIVVLGCVLYRRVLHTPDALSSEYTRSVSNLAVSGCDQQFYVSNNTLYFATEDDIRYVKNNWVCKLAKTPNVYQRFVVLDDATVILEKNDTIYRLNKKDNSLTELWQGNSVGHYGNQVYFTRDNTLYVSEVTQGEPQEVVTFDELLGVYDDGIVYKSKGCIYQLLFREPDSPQILVNCEIAWPDAPSFFGDSYLYTSDYALHVSCEVIDMYTYETGEMKRIYDMGKDADAAIMAVTARKKEFYVSRQLVDVALWPLRSKDNGTYRYDMRTDSWTKITNKTSQTIAQLDENSIYMYGLWGRVKRLKLDQ